MTSSSTCGVHRAGLSPRSRTQAHITRTPSWQLFECHLCGLVVQTYGFFGVWVLDVSVGKDLKRIALKHYFIKLKYRWSTSPSALDSPWRLCVFLNSSVSFSLLVRGFLKFIFGCAGSSLPCGLFSSCGVQASHCGSFSLQSMGSRRLGFSSCSMWLSNCETQA